MNNPTNAQIIESCVEKINLFYKEDVCECNTTGEYCTIVLCDNTYSGTLSEIAALLSGFYWGINMPKKGE